MSAVIALLRFTQRTDFSNRLIGLALIESLCIYALVIALIIIFAHPQAGAIAGLFAGGH